MSETESRLQMDGIWHRGYGLVAKAVMEDRNLTSDAKALYAFLASFTGGGEVAFPSVDYICDCLVWTRERFYKHRRQLLDLGYLTVEQTRKSGKQGPNIYRLPSHPAPRKKQQSENPTAGGSQQSGFQTAENPTTKKNSSQKEQSHTHTSSSEYVAVHTPTAPSEDVAPRGARVCAPRKNQDLDGFETFAARYPKPLTPTVRGKARTEWARLVADGWDLAAIEREFIAELAKLQAQGKEQRYWPNAYTFLATLSSAGGEVYTVPATPNPSASFASLPPTAKCPKCQTVCEHENGNMYWCATCQGAFPLPKGA